MSLFLIHQSTHLIRINSVSYTHLDVYKRQIVNNNRDTIFVTDDLNTANYYYKKAIEKCKQGDVALGISAADFRNSIARENGWSENLDTNVEMCIRDRYYSYITSYLT